MCKEVLHRQGHRSTHQAIAEILPVILLRHPDVSVASKMHAHLGYGLPREYDRSGVRQLEICPEEGRFILSDLRRRHQEFGDMLEVEPRNAGILVGGDEVNMRNLRAELSV